MRTVRRAAMNQKLIREIGRSQRLDILTALKRRGGMSVKELAAHFRMSYMGIKDHCLALEREGYLDTWRRPKPVGRPEMLYRLTTRARDLFPGAHNPLTAEVLEAVQSTYGPAAPTKILFGIFNQRTEAYRVKIKFPGLEQRAECLARLRDAEGYMADLERDGSAGEAASGENGEHIPQEGSPPLRIVEHHSPIEDLLRRYPILARLEREMFERVLNCPVRREEETAPGLYRCTFHIGLSPVRPTGDDPVPDSVRVGPERARMLLCIGRIRRSNRPLTASLGVMKARCGELRRDFAHAMSLISLIYVSSAQVPFSNADLAALLEISRRNNALIDVTGMLVYRDGNFMQAIEGEEETIMRLQEKITRDPRHDGLITLLTQRIEKRQFPAWSMGFRNLADPTLRDIAGYSEFLNTPFTETGFSGAPTRAQKLLLSFKRKG